MNQTTFVPEFDEEQMVTGYLWVTKVDEKGSQRGLMPVAEVADILREFVSWDAAGRGVRLISRFADSPFLAWGQNGAKWIAIKVIEPADHFLVSDGGNAYQVRLPRLIAKVGNHTPTCLFWSDAEQLTPATEIYPLMIGNINNRGWVCMGTSPLKCKSPDDIDSYIGQVIEIPATGHFTEGETTMDKFYQKLTQQWATDIGRKHGITIEKFLAGVQ